MLIYNCTCRDRTHVNVLSEVPVELRQQSTSHLNCFENELDILISNELIITESTLRAEAQRR